MKKHEKEILNTLWEKNKVLVTSIFSLVVFCENLRYCYSRVVVIGAVQKLTFCNVSVITEDIYLKLSICVCYQITIHTIKEDNTKCFFFFSELNPFFDLDFLILYQASQSRKLAPACSALVPFSHNVSFPFKERNHLKATSNLLSAIAFISDEESVW